jgi:hypothetical protein
MTIEWVPTFALILKQHPQAIVVNGGTELQLQQVRRCRRKVQQPVILIRSFVPNRGMRMAAAGSSKLAACCNKDFVFDSPLSRAQKAQKDLKKKSKKIKIYNPPGK